MSHYNASLQVFLEDDGSSRIVRTIDLLPNDIAAYVTGQMEEAMRAMKPALERA